MEEMGDVREVPQINYSASQQRFNNEKEGERGRVEDRLIGIGKMWKEKKERMIVESFDSNA